MNQDQPLNCLPCQQLSKTVHLIQMQPIQVRRYKSVVQQLVTGMLVIILAVLFLHIHKDSHIHQT